jgi:hypothetical protein
MRIKKANKERSDLLKCFGKRELVGMTANEMSRQSDLLKGFGKRELVGMTANEMSRQSDLFSVPLVSHPFSHCIPMELSSNFYYREQTSLSI